MTECDVRSAVHAAAPVSPLWIENAAAACRALSLPCPLRSCRYTAAADACANPRDVSECGATILTFAHSEIFQHFPALRA